MSVFLIVIVILPATLQCNFITQFNGQLGQRIFLSLLLLSHSIKSQQYTGFIQATANINFHKLVELKTDINHILLT